MIQEPTQAATLQILDSGTLREVALGDVPLTIGRVAGNDIVLALPFVSAHHARVEPDAGAHRIVDLASTNGMLVAGRRLPPNTPHALRDGDLLRIGDATTGGFVTLIYRNQAARRPAASTRARSYRLDPDDRQITIGRSNSDISLENPLVSRQHALIERHGAQLVLRDSGSTNGTFVNGRRISSHQLAAGDEIRIGAFRLVYDGDQLDEYDERGALRLDARHLTQVAPDASGDRVILSDVSLSIAPREFVALVGASGAGKSTLLGVLAGYAPAKQGNVSINGESLYANADAYRDLVGYVPQEDILHRSLPVERALEYAAELRLPSDTGPEEIAQRISDVLAAVDMTAQRTTTVAQLSGGQRKRVSIGAELLADPSLFFLDEPTSGLDPGLAKKLMYTLRRLADSGRTVVLVTHATAELAQCDHVAFLADGRLVFFGPPYEATTFFGVNTGGARQLDHFADIYSKLDGRADPADPERWAIVRRDLQAEYDSLSASSGNSTPLLAELWQRKFRASAYYSRYVSSRLAEQATSSDDGVGAATRPVKVSLLRQFAILARRDFDLLLRDRRNVLILLLQAPIIGLLLALLLQPNALVGAGAYANDAKRALFTLAVVAVWFGIINAAREIAKETAIYRRERLANLHIGPYVSAKMLVLGLLAAIQSILLIVCVGLRVVYPATGALLPGWAELLVTTWLTALAGIALGLGISAAAATPDRAISLVPLALIPQILFAGVIFSLGDGLTLQRALSWLTVSRWSMDAYGTTVNLNDMAIAPGLLRPRTAAAEYAFTPEHLIACWLILISYTLVCLALAAWLLKRRDARRWHIRRTTG